MNTARPNTTLSEDEKKSILEPIKTDSRQCPVCGEGFASNNQSKKYCSYECSRQAQNPPGPLRLRFGIFARDKFRCRYCGRGPKDGARLQIDHVVPNGQNRLINLITSCGECNRGKGNTVISEHRRLTTKLKCFEVPALSHILE